MRPAGCGHVCWLRLPEFCVVHQAADPEEERLRIKMRSAKRKMKGVNLQYVADRRVFFDDVAGIGEAKVSHRVACVPPRPPACNRNVTGRSRS
jgi:hypothetical protein